MTAPTVTGVRLAVDAGQTGTKVRVERDGREAADRLYPGVRTHEPLLPQLARIAEALHEEVDAPLDVVALGVSGLTGPDADAAHLLSLLGTLGTRRVLLTHDSVTSFLGSLGDRRGAVIAAGTGVVTLGVGATRVARVDGWGNIMGDAGSAYWIGRAALEAAMRAYDGRDAPTALTEVVRERWPNIEDAYIDLQSDPDRVRVVASFAESVTALAGTDAAAAQISLHAARELSRSVIAALEKVADPLEPDADEYVSAVGGVFRSEQIRTRFQELTVEARPHVHIEDARGTGLDGAALLPLLSAGHPLRSHISVAALDS
ncbi:BadF/BadG/BcrA/BcrD ATPase family protein [Microbacterium sp. M3]|uniref:BadF/BadG/BcrA/BcrD ATPase family protein n=1 Tax=Microbacterium arthrosphaerae TaxID=792652 RepID=A0ABU4GXV8_9MICO|nr:MULTISPECIES: BadF/BadG/BcrA/BcrD ATPase family protein [Microbacterium]MDW4571915.1 BadF/BadG/BcrA/BcrD ATPase family protein [Microbacterium arthrosphaerae]MDW7605770.1 BadF/BadG/BcrA/BcrD ATPase family protein [Microbacterium sp. M3]